MATRVIPFDAPSPLITYAPSNKWGADDGEAHGANGSTIINSVTTGATATLKFWGSAIWVYGPKRMNHGYGTASVDNGSPQNFSAYSGSTDPAKDTFQQLLWSQTGLQANVSHTLVLANAGPGGLPKDNKWLGIDWISVEQPFNSTSSSSNNNIQVMQTDFLASDNSSAAGAWQWFGSWDTSQWSGNNSDDGSTSGSSRTTTEDGAFVSFLFHIPDSPNDTLAAVALYGARSSSTADYKVNLQQVQSSGNKTVIVVQKYDTEYGQSDLFGQVFFYAGNLPVNRSYAITITNVVVTSTVNKLELLKGRVWTVGSPGKAGLAAADQPSTSSSHQKSGLGAGAIAGIAVGGALVLLILAALGLLFIRKRRRRNPRDTSGKYGRTALNEPTKSWPESSTAEDPATVASVDATVFPAHANSSSVMRDSSPSFPPHLSESNVNSLAPRASSDGDTDSFALNTLLATRQRSPDSHLPPLHSLLGDQRPPNLNVFVPRNEKDVPLPSARLPEAVGPEASPTVASEITGPFGQRQGRRPLILDRGESMYSQDVLFTSSDIMTSASAYPASVSSTDDTAAVYARRLGITNPTQGHDRDNKGSSAFNSNAGAGLAETRSETNDVQDDDLVLPPRYERARQPGESIPSLYHFPPSQSQPSP